MRNVSTFLGLKIIIIVIPVDKRIQNQNGTPCKQKII